MRFRIGVGAALLAVAALGLSSSVAWGQSVTNFADWTSVAGSPVTATGTLPGGAISLSGSDVLPAGSTIDGSAAVFNRPEFTPALATSDAVGFSATSGKSYTLTFAAAVTDPVLDLGSLGSTMHFPPGTQLTRVSGDTRLSVSGTDIVGVPDFSGSDDGNGTVRISGSVSSITFTTSSTSVTDGVYLQVGVPDVYPPHTIVTSGPDNTTRWDLPVPPFQFHGDEPGDTFECQLDASGWVPCSSPYTLPSLPDGLHIFVVRATDSAGNVDPGGVARSFIVTHPVPPAPDTTIITGPFTTWVAAPQFRFFSSSTDASFECRVDLSAWAACVTGYRTPLLDSGDHVFDVRAVSPQGAADPTPSERRFTIESPTTRTTPGCTLDYVREPPKTGGDQFKHLSHQGIIGCIFALDPGGCSNSDVCQHDGCPWHYACTWPGQKVCHDGKCIQRGPSQDWFECPRGARCTVTGFLSWRDADGPDLSWSVSISAGFFRLAGSMNGEYGTGNDSCRSSGRHRCTATAAYSVTGSGQPIYARCAVNHVSRHFTRPDNGPGDPGDRKLSCGLSLHIRPAVPPAATASGAT
jgi:hypothetical protein